MKKRKIISLLLIIVLSIGILSACGPKEPKEILKKATEESADMKTGTQSFEMGIKLDIPMENEDPFASMILNAINNGKISGTFASDTNEMKTFGDFTLDLDGISYKCELYFSPEKSAIKVPMVDKYILLDDEEMKNMSDEDQVKEMQKLSIDMVNSILDELEDDSLSKKEDVVLNTPEGDVKVTEITMDISDEKIKTIIKDIVPTLFENPAMREMMVPSIKQQLELEGKEATDEAVQAELDNSLKEFNEGFTEIEDILTFNEVKIVYGVDDDYNIRSSKIKLDYKVQDKETGEELGIVIDAEGKVWGINEPIEIEEPELTEENSIKMEELMNQFMMPMPEPELEQLPEEQ